MQIQLKTQQLGGDLLEGALKKFGKAMETSALASGGTIEFKTPEDDRNKWWDVIVTIEWKLSKHNPD